MGNSSWDRNRVFLMILIEEINKYQFCEIVEILLQLEDVIIYSKGVKTTFSNFFNFWTQTFYLQFFGQF